MEPKTRVDDGKVLLKEKNPLATAFDEENALFFTSHVFPMQQCELGTLMCVFVSTMLGGAGFKG